jgi:hypothetical protein
MEEDHQMLKMNRIVAAVAVIVCVGVVYGAAVKIRSLPCTLDGCLATENLNGDGFAIINANSAGSTEIQVAITDFKPDTTYGVQVFDLAAFGCTLVDAITTNVNGNGSGHIQCGDEPANPPVTVIIFIWDGDAERMAEVSAAEIRAQGTSN